MAVGYLVVRSPIAATVLVLAVGAVIFFALDREHLAIAGVMVLPWLVVFGSFMPPLVKTFVTGGVVVLLLIAVGSLELGQHRVVAIAGTVMFLLPVTLSLISNHGPGAFPFAAKLAIFPVMVLVATSPRGREILGRGSTVILASA